MTAVYRAYDSDGSLLYVGIAKNWGSRWAQHAEHSPFFGEVARLEVRYVASREEALTVEADAIRTERPVWNKAHAPRRERRFRLLTSASGGPIGIVPAEWLP